MAEKSIVEIADTEVADAVAPLRHTLPVRILGTLSEVADQPPLISLCAATLAAGIVAGDRRLALAGSRMLAAEIVATLMKDAIKRRIDRTRPHVVHEGGDYAMRPGCDDDHAMTSFPSGHTAGAVAVARAVARDYPGAGSSAHIAAAAVAAIQIPRCKHYVSDIVVGAAIGVAAERIVGGLFDAAATVVRRRTP